MNERKKLIDTFMSYNSQINLSAIRDPEWIYQKHILDSLELNSFFKVASWSYIADIGTWWGFPLLPLAMTNPKSKFLWIDSTRKKIDTVNKMIEEIWIKNAKAVWTRIEDYIPTFEIWKFDYITARAVWMFDKIINRSIKLLKRWGFFIFYKKFSLEEETLLFKIMNAKNLKLVKKHCYKLENDDTERIIYVIQKL